MYRTKTRQLESVLRRPYAGLPGGLVRALSTRRVRAAQHAPLARKRGALALLTHFRGEQRQRQRALSETGESKKGLH